MGGKTALKSRCESTCFLLQPSCCSRKGEKETVLCLLFLDLSSGWFLISLLVT